ncbi:MAG TPA: DUF2339 domain-containing protein [Armatimonadota bacterium]|nr:DUF2339 domain-containing protein [Armatimonadota bacterium]
MYESGFVVGLLLLLALFVVFPVYVLIRLAALNRAMGDLRELARRVSPREEAPATEAADLRRRVIGPLTPLAATPSVTVTETPLPPPTPASPPLIPPPPPPPSTPATPAASRPDLESVLGANWLSKLGVAAIAIAVAFFLKYAFDSNWIGDTARVTAGLVAAAILLSLGQVLLARPTYRAYAQVLTSGGVVILFLSIYAAHTSYHLIGWSAAFVVLAAAALAASALAMANNTEAVALLCLAGAFATPVLLHRDGAGAGDLVRLYAYLAALNLWSAALLRYRPWRSLTALSFGATWLLFFGAGNLRGQGLLTEGFAAVFLFFACYGGIAAVKAAPEAAPETQRSGVGMILAGCVAFVIASALILVGVEALGLPALAGVGVLTALLLAVMAAALPPLGAQDPVVRQVFSYLSAVVLVLLVGASAAMAPSVSRAQAPYSFAFALFSYLLFLGVALHMRRADEEGPAVFLVAVGAVTHLMVVFHALAPLRIWGVNAAPLWLPLAGLIMLGVLWISTRQEREGRYFPMTVMIAAQALPLVAFLAALYFVGQWPARPATALFLGEFLLISGAWVGMRRLTALPAFRGDLLAAFGNAAVFFGLLAAAARLQSYQGLVLLCGCAIALAAYHAFVGASVLRRPQDDALLRFTYLGLALTFLTIAIPLQLKAAYITLAWAVESALLVWSGLAAGERRMRWYGVALFAITAAKALFVDNLPSAHFRFLLNQRMLSGASVVAAAYVSAWMMWRRRDALAAQERSAPAVLALVANAFTLIFVSLDLWAYFGQRGALAGRGSIQQLSLSIFWSIYALAMMAVGIGRRLRPVRLFAMGLLYLSIFKVFLFDLRFLEQPYRIVSFFGLGVILLVVSLLYTRFEGRLHEESDHPGGGDDSGAAGVGGPAPR